MEFNPEKFTAEINAEISRLEFGRKPPELYEPIRYIMALGGKRLRPLLVGLGHYLFAAPDNKILTPAVAVEVFHNFTLMHDDIMDKAPLRRGQPTVHEKWNPNVAILSGDVMLIKVYELLLQNDYPQLALVLKKFNTCAAQVCEGQQFDMNFEKQSLIAEADYLNMIRLKTAVLLGFSLELGAILADAPEKDRELIRNFGEHIGIGFQLKDDLLDVYADQSKFGKQVGGDIVSNKKTFLLIEALELAKGKEKQELLNWLQRKEFDKVEKVSAVTRIYDTLGIRQLTEGKMNGYFELAFQELKEIRAPEEKKRMLERFAKGLIGREK